MNQADLFVVCPYNRHHIVKKYRLLSHINKCRERYQDLNLETCKFNHHHLFKRDEDILHCQGCPAQLTYKACDAGSEDEYLKFGEESDEEFYETLASYRTSDEAAKDGNEDDLENDGAGRNHSRQMQKRKRTRNSRKARNMKTLQKEDSSGQDVVEPSAPRKNVPPSKRDANQASAPGKNIPSPKKNVEPSPGKNIPSEKKSNRESTPERKALKKNTGEPSGKHGERENPQNPLGIRGDVTRKRTFYVPRFRRPRPVQPRRRNDDIYFHYATKRAWRRGESPSQSELDREEAKIREQERQSRCFRRMLPKSDDATDQESRKPSSSKHHEPEKNGKLGQERQHSKRKGKLDDVISDSDEAPPRDAWGKPNGPLTLEPLPLPKTRSLAFKVPPKKAGEGSSSRSSAQNPPNEDENENSRTRFNPLTFPLSIFRAFSQPNNK